jgi:uncharacterized protein YaiL (DUF2058 family)
MDCLPHMRRVKRHHGPIQECAPFVGCASNHVQMLAGKCQQVQQNQKCLRCQFHQRCHLKKPMAAAQKQVQIDRLKQLVEKQKKGQEMLGRTIKTDPRIEMDHFIVWQPDGLINSIYLVLGPEKFISN